MRYRKLTSDNDMVFGNGQLDFWRDVPEAVGQSAMTRLLLWLGEWFLDIEEGTPYMQGILGKHSLQEANTIIQDRVLTGQGVVDIQDYETLNDQETRTLTPSFKLDTIYGPTKIQVANYANY